ncbi:MULTISPECIES: HD domain-containing phosphohydrolase [Deefgea]|uniref:GAF domain-containing protein n=1 Tax=Deefgea chitinilytica TaxID=570276 RepID=A0ABS2C7V8_9NEIS|nr:MULTISPECIES: HD domain-containing phosphohydrolase [Deefgea]MBM5570132.1 GAF domain-containing protein [Deefgea chitinilytica]MBM9887361.1 GAF domain-containing protein [Deefgea sp. CFH1-16]
MNAAEFHERLEKLNSIGIALSGETHIHRLVESILVAATDLVQADAGTLYLIRDQQLHFEIVLNTSLGIAMGGTSGVAITFPSIPLVNQDGTPNLANVVACAVNQNKTINVPDAYATDDEYDFSGTRRFDQSSGYHSKSFLSVPMRNHEGEVIGALQLINATTPLHEIIAFSSSDQHLVESLASQAAIAITNRMLINSLQKLFEGFINLINLAIDDKSPYTSGHCQRVPELTMMLAEAAHRTTEGALAHFTLTERDRYELKIAGLLHDCGKITTPVHVVDKATKLQTISDRIELIDTRFEVLLRDIEIRSLRGAMTLAEYELERQQLLADRAFLRQANLGGEMMSDDDVAQIARIAKRQWAPSGGEQQDFLTADEFENLAIRKGTLTPAERKIINHHIDVTIQMLEALPWPKHLLNVPEYAGGHHERMDGKGYPKGLRRDQMSVQARIMGIADVFEALTARDRPYKEGMKLSVALGILTRMACEQHVDHDLLEVFLREKVWLNYAEQFLEPSQCDTVDISQLLEKIKGIAL